MPSPSLGLCLFVFVCYCVFVSVCGVCTYHKKWGERRLCGAHANAKHGHCNFVLVCFCVCSCVYVCLYMFVWFVLYANASQNTGGESWCVMWECQAWE